MGYRVPRPPGLRWFEDPKECAYCGCGNAPARETCAHCGAPIKYQPPIDYLDDYCVTSG